jgi:hypothetical protein
VITLTKILIIVSLVGLLRSCEKFRTGSRQFDEQVFAALKRMMHASEEAGYPAQSVPLLLILSALFFMLSLYAVSGVR